MNNVLLATRIRLNNLRNAPFEPLPAPPPQPHQQQQQQQQLLIVDNNNQENNQLDLVNDDEIELFDSDSDDLINEGTDGDDDAGLVSL